MYLLLTAIPSMTFLLPYSKIHSPFAFLTLYIAFMKNIYAILSLSIFHPYIKLLSVIIKFSSFISTILVMDFSLSFATFANDQSNFTTMILGSGILNFDPLFSNKKILPSPSTIYPLSLENAFNNTFLILFEIYSRYII